MSSLSRPLFARFFQRTSAVTDRASTADPAPVTVYSRPGCPYCFRLRHGLRRRRVSFYEINIWTDPDAAAAVRAAADGNETVPTVHVAGRWLVNPRAKLVQALAAAPNLES